MFRLIYLTFFGTPRLPKVFAHAHESPAKMTAPLIVLAVLSIIGGYGHWFEELVRRPQLSVVTIAVEGSAAHGAISGGAEAAGHEAARTAHTAAMILSILAAAIGILLSTMVYYWKKISADDLAARFKGLHKFLWNKWYFDELYHASAIAGTLGLSRISAWFDLKAIDAVVDGTAKATVLGSWASGWNDNKIVDGLVNWVARVITWFGATLREVQTGKVQSYILMALGAVILFYVLQLAFA
jgi:NADH-quinone oxidoreductase subunit L